MRIHWIFPTIEINKRVKGTPKAKSIRAQHSGKRKISQEQVRELREGYAKLPRGPGGGIRKGTLKALIASLGLPLTRSMCYYNAILNRGLRDDERE